MNRNVPTVFANPDIVLGLGEPLWECIYRFLLFLLPFSFQWALIDDVRGRYCTHTQGGVYSKEKNGKGRWKIVAKKKKKKFCRYADPRFKILSLFPKAFSCT